MAKAKTQHPWLAKYPSYLDWGMDISTGTLPELWDAAVARFADRPFMDFLGNGLTYAQTDALVDKAAAGLQKMGVEKGDRVGLFLPNCIYFPVFYYAICKLGGIVVNFNPTYPAEQVEKLTEQAGVKVIITTDLQAVYPNVGPVFEKSRANGGSLQNLIICPFAGSLSGLKSVLFPLLRGKDLVKGISGPGISTYKDVMSNGSEFKHPEIAPSDVAALQFTGGTTGLPKAATLTHENIYINCQQAGRWFSGIQDGQERILTVLPLFHVFAMTICMNYMAMRGCEMIMQPNFDKDNAAKALGAGATIFAGVPAMFNALANHPDIKSGKIKLDALKYCVSGGAAMPYEIKQNFEKIAPCSVTEGYGLSETSPIATANPVGEEPRLLNDKINSIGLPVPNTVIEIVDENDSSKLMPTGERGEIAISGPQVMQGYWARPEATEECLQNGRFLTGDIGVMDADGYTYIVDRKKDVIVTNNGFNVYPRDIEEILFSHQAIAECAICGVPDSKRGETILAAVVLHEGASLSADEVASYLKGRIVDYMMPERIEFMAELPKSQVGKILKKDIREIYAA